MDQKWATPQSVGFKNLNKSDVLDVVSKYKFTINTVKFSDIALDDEGHISYGGETYPFLYKGLINYCICVGIPISYAKRIPYPVLKASIKSLSTDKECLIVHRASDNAVVNVTKHISAYRDLLLINALRSIFPDWRSHYVAVCDNALYLDLIRNDNYSITIGSDIISIGMHITNSSSGFFAPLVQGFVERETYKTGAILPRNFGIIKTHKFDAFLNEIPRFEIDEKKLQIAMEYMATTKITIDILERLWIKINNMIDEETADLVFGCSKDYRKNMFRIVYNKRNTRYKKPKNNVSNEDSKFTYYDIYNKASLLASKTDDVEKHYLLQRIAGDLTGYIKLHLNTTNCAEISVKST